MPKDLKTTFINQTWFRDTDFLKKIPVVTFLSGDQVGRRIMLANDNLTFGRSSEATIMLRDSLVSRLHIAIGYSEEYHCYIVRDLDSTNGSFLNGNRFVKSSLNDLDKILIGNTVLRFGWSDVFDIKYHTEIDNLLNIDELTGLIIKRRFDEELNRYTAVALSNGSDLAMMMIDIDGMKKINDTYGHAFGAYTISQTGKLIKAATEQKGMASRFGGDEFMIFLPNFPSIAAMQLAENIRYQVERYTYELEGIILQPTVSLGVSLLKSTDTVESLFRRADEALYTSKRTGKNKVTLAQ